jgi:glycosyltransferase involved in cell wall biosynthesis
MPSLVSVVIPSFNGARFLGEAIDSVLAQTHPAIEVLVVDDGSVDETPALVARYGERVRYLRQENRGLAAARNTGIRAARGAYVAFLDHDDRFLPAKIAAQAGLLDARDEVGLVYTGWCFIDDQGQPLPPTGWVRREGDLLAEVLLGNIIYPAATMLRRTLLDEVGGFDEARTGVEDWELWLRLSRRGVLWACVDEPLLEYRVHAAQMHKHGAGRRLSNRLAVLSQVFADPRLPPAVRALEPRAFQSAYLRGAADYYAAGERGEGGKAFLAALRARPAILAEPRSLYEFCRLLVPIGFRSQAAMVADWRRVTTILRTAVADALGTPGLEPELARLRWRARMTVIRVTARLIRKRWIRRRRG